jgi:5-methyltetrahydrofolate--homocysteine methyltransferase
MSALLTTTVGEMEVALQALAEAGLRGRVKVMVGAAPLTRDSAKRIGADRYAADAPSVVDLAKEWLRH